MPLYFFDLHDGEDHIIDDFGMDFDRFEEARNHAVSLLPDIAREELPNGPRRDFACDIREEGPQIVYQAVLNFREDHFGVDKWPNAPAKLQTRYTDDVTAVSTHALVSRFP